MTTTSASLSARWIVQPNRPLRAVLSSRKFWLVLGVFALVAGTALNWSWIVVAGAAPILLKLLPCAAMCALGLCARGSCRTASDGSVSRVVSAATPRAAR